MNPSRIDEARKTVRDWLQMSKSKKQSGDAVLKFSEYKRKRVDELETNIDALFQLPLAEFTGARNALAAQMKKSGRGDDSVLVKALAKPPVSAWAVNQLYWNHREAFDRLIASGERFHKAQISRQSGKAADMRSALDARREALSHLTDLATALLRDADHSPSLDIIRRITSTLEAMSAMSAMSNSASRSDAPRPGRLTHDVDPPGFESFASFVPAATKPEAGGKRQSAEERQEAGRRRQSAGTPGTGTPEPSRSLRSAKSDTGAASARQKEQKRRLEEARLARIAAAKVSLQTAKRSLTKAQARTQSLETAQKKADAEAKKSEKHRRDVEASLEKAKAASEDAARRARSVATEVEEAARAVEDADRIVEKASKELESLVHESSGR